MKRPMFTQGQIIGALREQEVGAKTTDVYLRPGPDR